MEHRDGDAAVAGARVVDHLVHHHLAVLGHRERGLVGQNHADGAVVPRFQGVALEDRVADLELDPRAVRADRHHRPGQGLHLAYGLAAGDGLRDLDGIRRAVVDQILASGAVECLGHNALPLNRGSLDITRTGVRCTRFRVAMV